MPPGQNWWEDDWPGVLIQLDPESDNPPRPLYISADKLQEVMDRAGVKFYDESRPMTPYAPPNPPLIPAPGPTNRRKR